MAIEFGPKDIYRTYGVPSLDLTFADKKSLVDRISGNNLITFTRSTTGTYVGSDGLIKTAAVNEPRFDHNPLTRESLGLLVEEARTNSILYSGDFSNVAWVEAGTTKTANALVSPDGTTTAALVVPTATSGTHKFRQNVSTADSALTFSVYLKSAGYSRIALNEQAQIGSSSAIINLTDGSGATSGTVVSNAGNGWYRVSWSSTFGSGTPKIFCVVVLPNGGSGENPNNFTWTGDGTSGIYIWGAQLEAGAYPTSYIPTTTATVTRAADVASITGSNFSSWYNTNAGTTFFDARVKTPAGPFSHGFLSQESTGHFRCGIYNTNWYAWTPYVGGIGDVGSGGGVIDGRNRGIFSYDKSIPILAQSFNGNAVGSLAGRTPVSPTSVPLVYSPGSVQVSRLTYYPTRLPDTTLQALTKL